LKFFKTCPISIGAYPNMIHSELKPEDMQKIDGDDPCDTDRYAMMAIFEKAMPKVRNYQVEAERTESDKLRSWWEKQCPGVEWAAPEPQHYKQRVLH